MALMHISAALDEYLARAGRHPHPNDPDNSPYADEYLHDWDRDDEVTPEAPDDGRDLRDPAPIGDPWVSYADPEAGAA